MSGALRGPLERPLRPRPGCRADADQVADQHPAEPPLTATPRADVRAGLQAASRASRAACPPASGDERACTATSTLVAPPGHLGRLQGLPLRRRRRATSARSTTRRCCSRPTRSTLAAASLGVAVLDMSDPAHPVQTDTLTEPPMLTPHESLNLNAEARPARRGDRQPGDLPRASSRSTTRTPTAATRCCSRPRRVARFGHESGFSPDGKTFYATGTALQSITAIDVTDPKNPHADLAGQHPLPRHDAQRRRQPRLHRRPQRRRHADPRHQPDPGAQAEPAGARDQPADLGRPRRSRRTRSRSPRTATPTCSSSTSTPPATLSPTGNPTRSARRGSSTSPTRRSRA